MLSPLAVGEVGVEVTVSPWRCPPGPDLEGSKDVDNVSIVALTRSLYLARGAKAYSPPTLAPRGQLSQKVKAVLDRLRKFLTCGPSAGRV